MMTSKPKPLESESSHTDRRSPVPVILLVFILGTVLSLTAFFTVRHWEQSQIQSQLQISARTELAAMQSDIAAHVEFLDTTAGLFAVTETVTASAFRDFVQPVLNRHSDIRTISWNPRIKAAERATFEQRKQREGLAGYRILEWHADAEPSPASPRAEYFPAEYTEPPAGNEVAGGFDIASDRDRLTALQRARDTGKIVFSGRLRLIQDVQDEYGYLALRPVYLKGAHLDTVAERREALEGFVASSVRYNDWMNMVLEGSPVLGIDIWLLDDAVPASEAVLHFHSSRSRDTPYRPTADAIEQVEAGLHWRTTLDVPGRQWSVLFAPAPAFLATHPQWQCWASLVIGLLLTFLLIGYLAFHRREVERVAQTNAAILKERNRLEAILAATPDFQVLKNRDGVYMQVNPAFCHFINKDVSEIIGKTDYDLFPQDEAKKYIEDDARVMETGEPLVQDEHVTGSGGIKTWLQVAKTPLRDLAGTVHGVLISVRNITESKRAEQELIDAKEQAEEASRAKSLFLTKMSHELRTPLNAILGFAQIMDMDKDNPVPPRHRKGLTQILGAGWHLLEVINDLLDLATIEAGKLELHLQPVDLGNSMSDATEVIRPLAELRSIDMTIAGSCDDMPYVEADPVRLKQVLLNLLANAVKYNRESGQITVACEHTPGGRVRITISDTGPGIAAEDLESIFQPFSRLFLEGYAMEGSGIGLSLCKQMVEGMAGRIGVESTPGEGSLFWIELPEATAPAAQSHHPRATEAVAVETGESTTILYVEDSPSHVHLMETIIGELGNTRLLTANNGELGLEMAVAHRPDLIMLDISIPEMDGFEVLKRLQAHPDTRETPVIALSANAMSYEIESGLAAGFMHYLTKPLDVPSFMRLASQLLNHAEAR